MDVNNFINYIKDSFVFLETDYSYHLSEVTKNLNSVLKYRGNNFGIDIEIEYLDYSIFILIVHTVNGREPAGYYTQNGRIVRKHLYQVLLDKKLISNDQVKSLRVLYKQSKKYEQDFDGNIKKLSLLQREWLKDNIEFLLRFNEEIFMD